MIIENQKHFVFHLEGDSDYWINLKTERPECSDFSVYKDDDMIHHAILDITEMRDSIDSNFDFSVVVCREQLNLFPDGMKDLDVIQKLIERWASKWINGQYSFLKYISLDSLQEMYTLCRLDYNRRLKNDLFNSKTELYKAWELIDSIEQFSLMNNHDFMEEEWSGGSDIFDDLETLPSIINCDDYRKMNTFQKYISEVITNCMHNDHRERYYDHYDKDNDQICLTIHCLKNMFDSNDEFVKNYLYELDLLHWIEPDIMGDIFDKNNNCEWLFNNTSDYFLSEFVDDICEHLQRKLDYISSSYIVISDEFSIDFHLNWVEGDCLLEMIISY